MTDQLELIPPAPRLTERQQRALHTIQQQPGGLTDTQLGMLLHEWRGCGCARRQCAERGYDTREGRQMGAALRRHQLVVKKQRTHWQVLEGQTQPPPVRIGAGDLPEGF